MNQALSRYRYTPAAVADAWERWCGETAWSRTMRSFDGEGRYVIWFGGYPRSASAIPLCFVVYDTEGHSLTTGSRLRDLKTAAASIKSNA